MIIIYIYVIIAVIKCGYYPLFAYEVMNILDYYLNLYVRLNNAACDRWISVFLKGIKNNKCHMIVWIMPRMKANYYW
jgi:hypothetical protein